MYLKHGGKVEHNVITVIKDRTRLGSRRRLRNHIY